MVNSYLDPLGHYSLSEYSAYLQNKLTISDSEHEDGKLYIGFCKSEYYEANLDYLRRNWQKAYYHIPVEYDCCSACLETFPHRICYSEKSFQEEKTDNYRKFLPNNYRDMSGESGVITNLFVFGGNLFVHTEEALWQLPRSVQEKIIGDIIAYVGTGEFLSLPPVKIIDDTNGMSAGSRHQWATLIFENNVLFIDEYSRKIYLLANNGLQCISDIGENKWFNVNIPIQQNITYKQLFGSDFPAQDNPAITNGNGYLSVYDKANHRIIITKKDTQYILITLHVDSWFFLGDKIYPSYTAESQFVIDNTPAGYSFLEIDKSTAEVVYSKLDTKTLTYYSNTVTPSVPATRFFTMQYQIVWICNGEYVDAAFVLANCGITLASSYTIGYQVNYTDYTMDIDLMPYTIVTLIYVGMTTPVTCSEGDIYFNTVDNLLYTATADNTWSVTGDAPLSDIYYYNEADSLYYGYNNTTLVTSLKFPHVIDDTCYNSDYNLNITTLVSVLETLLGDYLTYVDFNINIDDTDCPDIRLIDIVVSLTLPDVSEKTLCKEWYKWVEEVVTEEETIEAHYELVTDEAELLVLYQTYIIIIYVYKNQLLYMQFELPSVSIDDCENTVLTWCESLGSIKTTDVISIYEEIYERETDGSQGDLVYGFFQQLTEDENGNFILANKPRDCSGGGGGSTDDYFNIILYKCLECSDGGCITAIDACEFKVTFIQTVGGTITHEYHLYYDNLGIISGSIVTPLECTEYDPEDPTCCIKKCGSGAYPFTQTEIDEWGVMYPDDPYTWALVKAAFNYIIQEQEADKNGWSVTLEEVNNDCVMTITQSFEALMTTVAPSLFYIVNNVCCCDGADIQVIKFGVSYGLEITETSPIHLVVTGGLEEIITIEESGTASSSNYYRYGEDYFSESMVWNKELTCEQYLLLKSGEYTVDPLQDNVYKTVNEDPLVYASSYFDENENILYILNTYNCSDSIEDVIAAYIASIPAAASVLSMPSVASVAATGGISTLGEGTCICIEETEYEITTTEHTTTYTEDVILRVPIPNIIPVPIDNGWTRSFDLKNMAWKSFHSYIPNCYIGCNDTFFSYHNGIDGLWKHNIIGKYLQFYGINYEHIIEFVFKTNPLANVTWDSVKCYVEAAKWDSINESFMEERFGIFNKIIAYNTRQCTGELTLVVKNTLDPAQYLSLVNQYSVADAYAEKNEKDWTINNFKDIVIDRTAGIWNTVLADRVASHTNGYIDKILNTSVIDVEKEWWNIEPFRDKFFVIRFIYDAYAGKEGECTVKLCSNNFTTHEITSY
jgi:hypothetical protein